MAAAYGELGEMMLTDRSRVLPIAALAAVCAWTGALAQEPQPAEPKSSDSSSEAPFEWTAEGDSVDDFEVEFTPIYEVDRSSPAELVKSYAAYGDGRAEALKAAKEIASKWQTAMLNSLSEYEEKLLSESAREALNATREQARTREQTYTETAGPIEVKGDPTVEDDLHWVEATQSVTKRERDWETGEWKESTEETRLRFGCVAEGDEGWRIDQVRHWGKDWENMDDEGNVPMAWIEHATPLSDLVFQREQARKLGEVPPIKQSTPEEAALSLFNSLIKRREQLGGTMVEKALRPWFEVLLGLFTEDYVERQEARFANLWADDAPARQTDTIADEGEVTVVKFKPRGELRGEVVELHLTKEGDAWKVHKAGYYKLAFDSGGEEIWEFTEEPDIYTLAIR